MEPLALAAVAAGAAGIMVEVHPQPSRALCDGPQSLDPAGFGRLMARLRTLVAAIREPVEPRAGKPHTKEDA